MKDIYLDSNAHCNMSPTVLKKYIEFNNLPAGHGNPNSSSVIGRAAATALEEARGIIAELIGAKSPTQIVFTNSCTQACEWVLFLIKQQVGSFYPFCSSMEHPAVRNYLDSVSSPFFLKSTEDGVIIIDYNIENSKVGICIHTQNEIGTIQPIEELRKHVKILFSDMSQSLGKIPMNVTELDVDYAAFSPHKYGGPIGVGFFYIKDTSTWREHGFGSRFGLDITGSPNVNGIVCSAFALQEAMSTLKERTQKMVAFQSTLEKRLKLLGFEIIGEKAKRSPNVTFAKVPGRANAGLKLMQKLGGQKIHVGLGSACGNLLSSSPLMEALGRPSESQDYVRISQFGEYDDKDAAYILEKIEKSI